MYRYFSWSRNLSIYAHDARCNGHGSRICYSRIRSGSMEKMCLHTCSHAWLYTRHFVHATRLFVARIRLEIILYSSCFVREFCLSCVMRRSYVLATYYIAKQYITLYIKSHEADVLLWLLNSC